MSHFQHQALANNIHHFIFDDANRAAVDEFTAFMEKLMVELEPDEPWLSIVDLSKSGMIPLRYGIKKITDTANQYLAKRPNRTVVVHDAGPLAQLGHALINPINNNVKFVTPDKFELGIEWLEEIGVRNT